MQPGEAFGPRLRQERERRQISLASIAANTKIGVPLLEGLERDDVSRWPSGIFRRSFVRAYARAIGLDPETVLREFQERFPDATDRPAPELPTAAGAAVTSTAHHEPTHVEIVLRVRVPRFWAGLLRWIRARRSGVLTVTEPEG